MFFYGIRTLTFGSVFGKILIWILGKSIQWMHRIQTECNFWKCDWMILINRWLSKSSKHLLMKLRFKKRKLSKNESENLAENTDFQLRNPQPCETARKKMERVKYTRIYTIKRTLRNITANYGNLQRFRVHYFVWFSKNFFNFGSENESLYASAKLWCLAFLDFHISGIWKY